MDGSLPEPQLPESHVLIVITDGLVPARGFLKAGLAPRPVFNDGSYPEPLEIVVDDKGTRKAVQSLRTPVSTYERRVRYCVLEFEKLLDSSSIDSTGWDQIARTVQRNYQLFDGFVILHGTDSLAYTSSALSFMFHNLGKPVVLTGSQAPMMNLQTDAQDNLLNSLIIAGHFMIPEVCLFFNFKLFRGNRATKISAEDFDAFGSPNLPPLATISSTRTNVLWHRVHRSTDLSPFAIQTNLDTAHVACLRVFPGITPAMVDAVLHLEGLKGLVLETFGAGNTPGGPDSAMTRCLADAVKRGIVIVNVTQCLSGSVSALYAPGAFLGRAGVVFGQDLTSEAALTKLAYLLSLPGATPDEVAKRMSVSLRGELTETTRTHFEHPSRSGVLTPELSSLTALGYAIQKGDLQATRDIIRGEPRWLLNDADYQMNSPVVIPISTLCHRVAARCNRHCSSYIVPALGRSRYRKEDVQSRQHRQQRPEGGRRHLAATSPNVEILRDFLAQGASVHLRNRSGNTPLFLAAAAGLADHVQTLIDAGAHLHSDEVSTAKLYASEGDGNAEIWSRVIG
ncbi:asparaginase-domain-containing protein [Bipolaris maydis]|nr:asparaginase-domain-containing protein [Bipolaris maydis]KAJ6198073.1 asparaginase-domain-containing protein [Bipolaris maydis]KAJ6210207.1 asparaginase-domain-containing protein [Bipolaris maydis]